MKTIFTQSIAAICLLFISYSVRAQDDPLLTLVTSLNPGNATHLMFQPSGDLDISYWSKDLIEIQIYIDDKHFNRQQLKALVPIGFYKIESEMEGSTLRVFMPNQGREVTINGKAPNNSLKFRMKMPHNLVLEYAKATDSTDSKTF